MGSSGGSTRIPKISELIREYFGKDKQNKVIKIYNPDEAGVLGSIIETGLTDDLEKSKKNNQRAFYRIFDVTSLDLGIDLDGKMKVLIKRNTTLPCTNTIKINPKENKECLKI